MGINIKHVLFLSIRYIHDLSHRRYIITLSGVIYCSTNSLRAVGVLFSCMVSEWAGGQQEKVCQGCISETVTCRKLILGRDIG